LTLTSITIPTSVRSIGESGFESAKSLQTVEFEGNSQLRETDRKRFDYRESNQSRFLQTLKLLVQII
jgi:hypothetical protein